MGRLKAQLEKEADRIAVEYGRCATCRCAETDHQEADADCVNGSFVALPRPCSCGECDNYREVTF